VRRAGVPPAERQRQTRPFSERPPFPRLPLRRSRGLGLPWLPLSPGPAPGYRSFEAGGSSRKDFHERECLTSCVTSRRAPAPIAAARIAHVLRIGTVWRNSSRSEATSGSLDAQPHSVYALVEGHRFVLPQWFPWPGKHSGKERTDGPLPCSREVSNTMPTPDTLAEPQVSEDEQYDDNDSDDVEDIHGSLLSSEVKVTHCGYNLSSTRLDRRRAAVRAAIQCPARPLLSYNRSRSVCLALGGRRHAPATKTSFFREERLAPSDGSYSTAGAMRVPARLEVAEPARHLSGFRKACPATVGTTTSSRQWPRRSSSSR
jgi:hypothetical protein